MTNLPEWVYFAGYTWLPGVVLPILLLYILYRYGITWARIIAKLPFLGYIGEVALLAGAFVFLLSSDPMVSPIGKSLPVFSFKHIDDSRGILALLVPLFILIHLRKGPRRFLISAFIWLAGASFIIIQIGLRKVRGAYAGLPPTIPTPELLVPSQFFFVSDAAIFLISVYTGLWFCFRLKTRIGGFVAAYVAAVTIMSITSYPFFRENIKGFALASLPYPVVGTLLSLLPRHRRAIMASLFPDRLERDRRTALASAPLLVGLAGVLAFQLYITPYIKNIYEVTSNNLKPPPRPAGAVNAMEILGAEYTYRRDDRMHLLDAISVPNKWRLYDLLRPQTRAQLESNAQSADLEELEDFYEEKKEIFYPIDRLHEADYFAPFLNGKNIQPGFLNLREAARFLGARATLRFLEGNLNGALEDIRRVYYLGGTIDEGGIVTTMIGSAIRGIGNSVTYNIYIQCRDDEDSLAQIAAFLEEIRPYGEAGLDLQNIELYEPAFQGIVIYADVMVSSYSRAFSILYRNRADFDKLRIAIALDRYRLDHGAYPDSLEPLVPDYLDEVPLEFETGEPYIFLLDPMRGEVDLQTPKSARFTTPGGLPFPVWKLDPNAQVEDFERMKKEREEKRAKDSSSDSKE